MVDETINVDLKANTAQYDRAMADAQSKTAKLGQAFESLAKVSAGIFVGTAATIGKTISSFSRFDNQIRSVKTLLDDNSFKGKSLSEGFKQMEDQILRLGSTAGQSFDTLNKALFDTVSAGVDASKAVEFVGVASKLAVAGVTDVSTATDGLTSAVNAYGIEASKADVVASKFFAAQKAGKTTIDQLSSGFGLVGANASAAGISLDELLAAVSAATLGGIRTNAAYTGLAAVISNIQKPTADAAKEAARLGIEFNAAALRSKGLAGFLDSVTTSAKFNDDTLIKLFGSIEGVKIAQTLAGSQSESFARTLKTLGNETSTLSTLNQAYIEQNGSLQRIQERLAGAIEAVSIKLGQRLAPTFALIVSKIDGAIKAFNDLDEETLTLITNGLKATAIVTGLVTAMGAIAAAVSFAGGAVAALAGTAAVGALIAGFTTLLQISDKLMRSIQFLGEGFKQVFEGITSFDLSKVEEGLNGIQTSFQRGFAEIKKETESNPIPLIVEPQNKQGQEFDLNAEVDKIRQDALGAKPVIIPVQAQQVSEEGSPATGSILESQVMQTEAERQGAAERVEVKKKELADKLKAQQDHDAAQLEQRLLTREENDALDAELRELDIEKDLIQKEEDRQRLFDSLLNKQKLEQDYAKKKAQAEAENRKKTFEDEQKFGKAFAQLRQAFRNENLVGATNAAQELTKLQQSESKKQQEIGKAAARITAAQDTARGAIAAYASLAGIPLVGPALGAAAAAALIAFGVEQQRKISAANQGGVIPNLNGGSNVRDSQLSFLTPGELVTPRSNFDEVVNAVADQRNQEAGLETPGVSGGGGMMEVIIGFKDDAFDIIEEKILERRAINTGVL